MKAGGAGHRPMATMTTMATMTAPTPPPRTQVRRSCACRQERHGESTHGGEVRLGPVWSGAIGEGAGRRTRSPGAPLPPVPPALCRQPECLVVAGAGRCWGRRPGHGQARPWGAPAGARRVGVAMRKRARRRRHAGGAPARMARELGYSRRLGRPGMTAAAAGRWVQRADGSSAPKAKQGLGAVRELPLAGFGAVPVGLFGL